MKTNAPEVGQQWSRGRWTVTVTAVRKNSVFYRYPTDYYELAREATIREFINYYTLAYNPDITAWIDLL